MSGWEVNPILNLLHYYIFIDYMDIVPFDSTQPKFIQYFKLLARRIAQQLLSGEFSLSLNLILLHKLLNILKLEETITA